MKKALITGITSQDASYLIELLLEKKYKVFGLNRQTATPNTRNISHLLDKIELISGDLTDQGSIDRAITQSGPDEIFHLGAQSFVKTSWDSPETTGNINGLGTLRVLEAIRKIKPDTKFYNAASSEMFGKVRETPQNEMTPFYPRSPYGVSKLYGYWITLNYRESYNLFACSGICFNHTSPRRGEQFVEQKIAMAAAKIKLGLEKELFLGNLDAKRDIGYAKDFVYAMWLMLQQECPEDFVIATGETHSIREMLDICFNHAGLNWQDYVKQDEQFMRPAEVDLLLGDAFKAKTKLGWTPTTNFRSLLESMVEKQLVQHCAKFSFVDMD